MNKLLIQIAAATLFLNYAAAFAQQPAATEEGQVQVIDFRPQFQNLHYTYRVVQKKSL